MYVHMYVQYVQYTVCMYAFVQACRRCPSAQLNIECSVGLQFLYALHQ